MTGPRRLTWAKGLCRSERAGSLPSLPIWRRTAARLCAALAAWAAGTCSPTLPAAQQTGDPWPGLTADELLRLDAGKALFERIFTVAEGIGPLFNENQCSACHTVPFTGGTGEQLLIRAARQHPDGSCDLLEEHGGDNLRRRSTPQLGRLGMMADTVPSEAGTVARFSVPFLFGLGAADFVTDEALLRAADPHDRDGDGISGRVGRTADGRIGRFGRKADVASLADFTHLALFLEMGLTTTAHPRERGPNGGTLPPTSDPSPDPEIDDATVSLITDFVTMLATPPRKTLSSGEAATAARGARIFARIGCTACHTPELQTGPASVTALNRVRVPLYSDLLLHDLGTGLASTCAAGATEVEHRTAPLLGLGQRRSFLYDLRAFTLEDAILLHGGEAQAARDAFGSLPIRSQQALLVFLRSM